MRGPAPARRPGPPCKAHLERLRGAAEFARVRSEGSRYHGKLCTLGVAQRAMPAADGDPAVPMPTRAGFITTKRVGKAVQRNRARRLMREALRALAPRLAPNLDLVLIAQAAIAGPGVHMDQVREELTWLAERAKILIA